MGSSSGRSGLGCRRSRSRPPRVQMADHGEGLDDQVVSLLQSRSTIGSAAQEGGPHAVCPHSATRRPEPRHTPYSAARASQPTRNGRSCSTENWPDVTGVLGRGVGQRSGDHGRVEPLGAFKPRQAGVGSVAAGHGTKRPTRTATLALETRRLAWLPVRRSWRLDERHMRRPRSTHG